MITVQHTRRLASQALSNLQCANLARGLSSILLGCLILGPLHVQAQTPKAPSKLAVVSVSTNAAAATAQKPRPIPFHGTLAAFSPSAKTLTVGKRIFVLTPETKLYKGEAKSPATIADARIGLPVTGSYLKSPDGKLLARSIYFKPAKTAAAVAPAKDGTAPE